MMAGRRGTRNRCQRRVVALGTVLCFMSAICFTPQVARASVFDDIGGSLATITRLRGVIRGLASGAGEGVREQLDRFMNEKVDPLITRVNGILAAQIDQASEAALNAINALDVAMRDVIDKAAHHAEQLTQGFFDHLNATLAQSFGKLEDLVDNTLCRILPDGSIAIELGPFGGANQVTVWRPLKTHCYRHYLAALDDPQEATFKKFDYFSGELCEYELKLGRIDPASPGSIKDAIAGYDKLAEMANTARCAAPTLPAKVEMVQKLLLYQSRAGLLRRLSNGR